MTSKLNRRVFLTSATAGTTLGAVAVVAGRAKGADDPIPLPDAQTKATVVGDANAECCTPASKLIFACSGAADVGMIADRAARKLTTDGVGKMFCLAGIGGRVEGIVETTKAAKMLLAIDGCPLHCASKCLQVAGFTKFEHICLADIGMKKGQTPPSDKAVDTVVAQGKTRLSG